jgi:hypothetical protein
MMVRYESYQVDNRDSAQMYEYLEARIDSMKRRIAELEKENQYLRHVLGTCPEFLETA